MVHCPHSFDLAQMWFSSNELQAPSAECVASIQLWTITQCPPEQVVNDTRTKRSTRKNTTITNIPAVGFSMTPLPVIDTWTGLVYLDENIFSCYKSTNSKPLYLIESFIRFPSNQALSIQSLKEEVVRNVWFRLPWQDDRVRRCEPADPRFNALFNILADFNAPVIVIRNQLSTGTSATFLKMTCDTDSGECKHDVCVKGAVIIDGLCHKAIETKVFSTYNPLVPLSKSGLQVLEPLLRCVFSQNGISSFFEVLSVKPFTKKSIKASNLYLVGKNISLFENLTYSQIILGHFNKELFFEESVHAMLFQSLLSLYILESNRTNTTENSVPFHACIYNRYIQNCYFEHFVNLVEPDNFTANCLEQFSVRPTSNAFVAKVSQGLCHVYWLVVLAFCLRKCLK